MKTFEAYIELAEEAIEVACDWRTADYKRSNAKWKVDKYIAIAEAIARRERGVK